MVHVISWITSAMVSFNDAKFVFKRTLGLAFLTIQTIALSITHIFHLKQ